MTDRLTIDRYWTSQTNPSWLLKGISCIFEDPRPGCPFSVARRVDILPSLRGTNVTIASALVDRSVVRRLGLSAGFTDG